MKHNVEILHQIVLTVLLTALIVGCGKQEPASSASNSKAAIASPSETLNVKRLEIMSQTRALQKAGKYMEAMEIIAPYMALRDQEVTALSEELKPKARVQSLELDLTLTPVDSWESLASIYSELSTLEPKNKVYAERSKYYQNRSKLEIAKADKAKADEETRQAKAEVAAKKKLGVYVGMRAEEVIQTSWGRPESVNKTVTKYGTHEQWVYGTRSYLYLDNGVVTGIQN